MQLLTESSNGAFLSWRCVHMQAVPCILLLPGTLLKATGHFNFCSTGCASGVACYHRELWLRSGCQNFFFGQLPLEFPTSENISARQTHSLASAEKVRVCAVICSHTVRIDMIYQGLVPGKGVSLLAVPAWQPVSVLLGLSFSGWPKHQ